MGPLFIKIGNVTYNAGIIRAFAFSTKQSEAAIFTGREAKDQSISQYVDDATITRLLEQLVERNMLIDLSPSAPPGA